MHIRTTRQFQSSAGTLTVFLLVLSLMLSSCSEPPALKPSESGAGKPAAAENSSSRASSGQTTATQTIDRSVLPKDAPKDAEIVTDITPGKHGGKLVISMLNEPKTFNPLLTQSADDQFASDLQSEGLYRYDWYLQKDAPGLAKSWEYDQARREWTFHLREGLLWSDGQPLTSDDFIFYSQLIFDPKIPNDEKFAFRLDSRPNSPLYEFRAPDPLTLVVKIPGKDSFSFQNLGNLRPLPRHVLEKPWKEGHFMETWGQNVKPEEMVACGRFRLKEMRPGEALIFERNPHFWRYDLKGQQLPYIDQLVVLIVGDLEANEVRFLAGDTDLFDSQSIKPDNLARFQDEAKAKDFTVFALGPGMNTNHYYFNLNQGGTFVDQAGKQQVWQPARRGEKPPASLKNYKPFIDPVKFAWFSNRDFRIACSELTNRQRMIDNIMFGEGTPLYGPDPPANRVWHNPNEPKFPYHPKSAMARLDKIGFIDRNGDGIREDPQGNPIRFTIVTNRENNIREKVVQLLKADLRAAGLDVQTQVLEFGNLVNAIKNTYAYDCCLLGLGTGIPPHPSMGSNVWLSSGQSHMWYPQQTVPATAWEEQLDTLYASMKRTFDLKEQRRIFFKMQDLFAEEQPAIHLFVQNSNIAAKNKIGNLKPTVLRNSLTHNLDELYIK